MDALKVVLALTLALHACDMSIWPTAFNSIKSDGLLTGGLDVSLGTTIMFQASFMNKSLLFWGYMSDRFDRVMILGGIFLTLGMMTLMVGFVNSVTALVAFRAIIGLVSAGIIPLTQSMLATSTMPSERGKYFGILGLTTALATMVGTVYQRSMSHPPLPGQTTPGSEVWRLALLCVSLGMSCYGVLLLIQWEIKAPISNLCRSPVQPVQRPHILKEIKDTAMDVKIGLLAISGALIASAGTAVAFMLSSFTHADHTQYAATRLFIFYFAISAASVVFAGYVSDNLARKYPRTGRIMLGLGASSGCVAVLVLIAPCAEMLLSGHYTFLKSAVTGLLGAGMMAAYYGSVKPLILEMVPCWRAGLTVAYTAILEGVLSVYVTPVIIGFLAEACFGYMPLAGGQGELSWTGAGEVADKQVHQHNLKALSKAIFLVMAVCFSGVFVALNLLKSRLPEDFGSEEVKYLAAQVKLYQQKKTGEEGQKAVTPGVVYAAHVPEGKSTSTSKKRRSGL